MLLFVNKALVYLRDFLVPCYRGTVFTAFCYKDRVFGPPYVEHDSADVEDAIEAAVMQGVLLRGSLICMQNAWILVLNLVSPSGA